MTRKLGLSLVLLLPAVFAAAQDSHMVSKGDTLWSLAGKYCGQPFQWEKLYDANKGLIKDPHWIYPDMRLSIPVCASGALSAAAELKPEPELKAAVPAQAPVAAEPPKPQEAAVPAKPQEQAPAISDEPSAPQEPAEHMEETPRKVSAQGNYKPMEAERMVVSDRMPKDMTWGIPSASAERLPPDWKADGKVRYANLEDKDDDLAALGDMVEVRMTSSVKLKPGDYLKVYRLGVAEKDADGKISALLAQQSALIKVASVEGSKVLGEIVRVFNPVEKGDLVKKL